MANVNCNENETEKKKGMKRALSLTVEMRMCVPASKNK